MVSSAALGQWTGHMWEMSCALEALGGRVGAVPRNALGPAVLQVVRWERPTRFPWPGGFWGSSCRGQGHPQTSSLDRHGASALLLQIKRSPAPVPPCPPLVCLLLESLRCVHAWTFVVLAGAGLEAAGKPGLPDTETDHTLFTAEGKEREPKYTELLLSARHCSRSQRYNSKTDVFPAVIGLTF